MELYPHQQTAVDKLHNGSILWGGVGTGKSLAALYYFYTKVCKGVTGDLGSLREPMDLYIITTAKKRDSLDWEGDAARLSIGRDRQGSVEGIKLTVDSWNNIPKYTEVENAFFIFDEQRLVGSGSWTKSFIKIAKSNKWILLSATPGDTWLDYIPVFVANGFYKNRTQFKREHVVYNSYSKFPKVERYLGVGKLVRLRNSILVEMPYERHTIRHSQDLIVNHDEKLLEKVVKKRWHVYENRPLRDVAELFSVMRKVVNSDESRLLAIRSLMETHPRLIVFYNFDYELEQLRTLDTKRTTTGSSLSLQDSSMTSTPKVSSTSTEMNSLLNYTVRNKSCLSIEDDTKKNTISRVQSLTKSCPTSLMRSQTSLSDEQEMRCSERTKKNTNENCIERNSELCLSIEEQIQRPVDIEFSKLSSDLTNFLPSYASVATPRVLDGLEKERLTSTTSTIMSGSKKDEASQKFQIAEWNGHKHEEIPETDRWVYLVQYVAGSEGWNCIETNAACFYSLTYSYKNFHQAHGRIDRLNTPFIDLYYYTLLSKSAIDRAVSKALKNKQSFNESRYGRNFDEKRA